MEKPNSSDQDEPDALPAKPVRKFRKTFGMERFPADSAARQSKIAILAWEALGGREQATEFLNTFDEQLGGRPLDLAIASEEGFETVSLAISARGKTASAKKKGPACS